MKTIDLDFYKKIHFSELF